MRDAHPAEPGLLRRLRPAPLDGNEVVLLQSGAEFFPALSAAIDAARREVWLETYIFTSDETAMGIAEALARAAERGAAVRVMIDGYGTRTLTEGIRRRWREAGVALLIYAPVSRLLTLDRSRLRRLHRKQACIDARVAFVGGLNMLDDLWDPNHGALEHPRLDYAVKLGGPVVAQVHAAMRRLWRQVAIAQSPLRFASADRSRTTGEDAPLPSPARPAGAPSRMRAMLVLRDNLANRRAIEQAYLKAIGGARRDVLIANAYFFPGRRFRRALLEAARRGVRVRLLLQGRAEYVLPHLATQSLYDPLLRAGVEIVEYHRSFLHAKVAVIDDWATVGSSNIDPFSLLLAREANVVVVDAAFAATLRERLLASMADGGRPVLHDEHARRPWTQRLWGWIATRLLRLGVAVSGHRQRY
jgi:cardiolipin synthase